MEIRKETAFNAISYFFARIYHYAITAVSCTYCYQRDFRKVLKTVGRRISEKVKEKKNET